VKDDNPCGRRERVRWSVASRLDNVRISFGSPCGKIGFPLSRIRLVGGDNGEVIGFWGADYMNSTPIVTFTQHKTSMAAHVFRVVFDQVASGYAASNIRLRKVRNWFRS
jgi:hypothetical protein